MEEGNTTKCKHCHHLIAAYEVAWVHLRNSELQTGWHFKHDKDGRTSLECGIDGCKCSNPGPENEKESYVDIGDFD